MENFTIVEANFASIANNDSNGDRVQLSVARHLNADGYRRFFIITDSDEHTGPEEKTPSAAKANASAMWDSANSPWDLQYS